MGSDGTEEGDRSSPTERLGKAVLLALILTVCLWMAGFQVPESSSPLAEEGPIALPNGTSVGRWASFFQLLQHINSTTAFEYLILRNWENLPAQTWRGSHGDVDILVSSKAAFAREVGCQYTGPNDVQCYVSCGDSRLVHFDVHAPEEAVDYYPPQWSRDMLATRVLSQPEASVSQGKGGVFRSSDVHYFYSLLYHFAYHGKKVVKDDYVPILEDLSKRVGATGWTPRSFRSIPDIKGQVDAFMACKGYKDAPQGTPVATTSPDCVQ